MAHVVCAWELGGHLGHLARFATLVPRLQGRGHRVTLLLRDLSHWPQLPSLEGAALMQAPRWQGRWLRGPRHPASLPEVLLHFGYAEASALSGLYRAWRNTLELLQPDLLLCDYAPTAMMASWGLGFPRARIGSGFGVPPRRTPMPAFRPVSGARVRQLETAEETVTGTARRVLAGAGLGGFGSLGEVLGGDASWLCTVPELDHYGPESRDSERYRGLATLVPARGRARWLDDGRPRLFAYLKPTARDFRMVLAALADDRFDCEVFAPGVTREIVDGYASASLRFGRNPFDLASTAAESDAVLCHAGHDSMMTALLSGCPLMLLPLQMEQAVVAQRAVNAGLGVRIEPGRGAATLADLMERAIASSRVRNRVRAFARRYRALRPQFAAERLVTDAETLLTRAASVADAAPASGRGISAARPAAAGASPAAGRRGG